VELEPENSPKPTELGNLAGAGVRARAIFQSVEPKPFFAQGSGSKAPEPCWSLSLGAMTLEPFPKFFTAKL